MRKSTIFIIDIDTTIANTDERAKLLKRVCDSCGLSEADMDTCLWCGGHLMTPQSSWDAFIHPAVMHMDTPEPKAQAAIHRMRELGMEFHFLTGRNEGLREVTEDWLRKHMDWDSTQESLIMRPIDDRGPASVCKEALFLAFRGPDLDKHSYVFMEDDPYVFRMFSKYGIVVKCPEGWDAWIPDLPTDAEKTWRR